MTMQTSYVDNPSPKLSRPGPDLNVRRGLSHRYTRSAPSVLPLPSLSSSSTSLSSRIGSTSTLPTPTSDSYDEYTPGDIVPFLKVPTISGTEVDQESEFDIPTPKPSSKAISRIPILVTHRQGKLSAPTYIGIVPTRVRSDSTSTLTPLPRNLNKPSSSAIPSHTRAVLPNTGLKKIASKSDSPIAAPSPSRTDSGFRRSTRSPRASASQPLRSRPTLAISFVSPNRPISSHTHHSFGMTSTDGKKDIGRRHSPSALRDSCARVHSTEMCWSHNTSNRTSSTPYAEMSQEMTPAARHAPHKPSSSSDNSTALHPSHSAQRMLRSTLALDDAKASISEKPRRHSSATSNRNDDRYDSVDQPLKPHQQILRARLERVLIADAQADRRLSDQAVDVQKGTRRRSRSRARSDASILGWLWNKGQLDDEEYVDDDESVALQVPSVPPPLIQAFAQTPYYTRFATPQQPALPSSSSSPSPSPSAPVTHRMRSYTSPVPSNSTSHNSFQASSHLPRPRHAFSLETVPSVSTELDSTHDGDSVSTGTGTGQIQLGTTGLKQKQTQRPARMPTPPPTPPPHHVDASRTKLENQKANVTVSSSRQNHVRRSTELVQHTNTGRHLPSNHAPRASSVQRESTASQNPIPDPASSGSGSFPEAKSRRKSTPVSGSTFPVVNSPDTRRRSIPTSTGAGSGMDPARSYAQQGLSSLVTRETAGRSQHLRQSTMPLNVNVSSSLPSPSSPSHNRHRHHLSTPTTVTSTVIPSSSSPSSPSPHSISAPHSPSTASSQSQSHSSPSANHVLQTSSSSFNAHTASMRCRQFDGYVSFAAVAGLEEPRGEDDGGEGRDGRDGSGNGVDREGSAAHLGWMGRILGL
ncbi:hypothetical protein F5880DRAFT_1605158 [Lentinula raphanica]|nr:hypothetical protein F5880DRAFT_1605158 [Lentinula raphanica]